MRFSSLQEIAILVRLKAEYLMSGRNECYLGTNSQKANVNRKHEAAHSSQVPFNCNNLKRLDSAWLNGDITNII
ncbi:hypothetical protein QR680_001936 [Steinernema hermaphroditum]|uniref:Uncharacterized protein n=1 Tax=Steinernema hermaphroditum TaxID=289476 RepID=A0AA39H3D1_9BILA|nr:hypothetical protein QR680_001936 [Steinernema hermaphroditum]